VATVASSYQVPRRRVYDLAIALDRREPPG
jgi:hypothetical protein